MASNCGISADLSGAINDRAIYHIDNAYFIPNLELTSHRCKTNTVSNTAFRGFGAPQGAFCIESIIDNIASFLSYNATFLPKIDRKVLELHGKGYTIQRISNHLREHFEYPLNKLGRSGKPYSVFFVHTKLKYLKLLILIFAKSNCLESVKISWQSM